MMGWKEPYIPPSITDCRHIHYFMLLLAVTSFYRVLQMLSFPGPVRFSSCYQDVSVFCAECISVQAG